LTRPRKLKKLETRKKTRRSWHPTIEEEVVRTEVVVEAAVATTAEVAASEVAAVVATAEEVGSYGMVM